MVREEDLRKQARSLFLNLDKDNSVIGTATTFIKDKNSSYLECKTLLVKNTKNTKRISNFIEEKTGRKPVMEKSKGFIFFDWQFFPQDQADLLN